MARYIKVKQKVIITLLVVVVWCVVCSIIEIPWFNELRAALGLPLAIAIILGLAFLPGIMISLTLCGIILDTPKMPTIELSKLPPITILVAAYNEEKTIYDTVVSIRNQGYPNKIFLKIINNNSKDNTEAEIRRAITDFPDMDIEYIFEGRQGKSIALNTALETVETEYTLTIDADSYLYRDALKILVTRMVYESRNKAVGAVAGAVLVKNSRANLLAQLQEYDYFLSIASIKRMQGLFGGSVLVAQGAFSIYRTDLLREIGGWRQALGEDICLTFDMLARHYHVYYEGLSVCFTNVPTNLKVFTRQRKRWARGLCEGLRCFNWREASWYSKILVFSDLFLFIIDTSICLFYIPGLLAWIFFDVTLIVGPQTFYLLPITILMFGIMFWKEMSQVFKPLGLKPRKHIIGFIIFLLTYNIILSPVCVFGYIEELIGMKGKWR